jgi:predicted ATPase
VGCANPTTALANADAAQLFVDRASKVRPNLKLGQEAAATIAQICRELDGVPLALELAAARVRILSLEQIAAGLAHRFRLLTGGIRGTLPRQQTLRASVDWSHELLSDAERALFRRLAVFADGFTLDAAEQVCHDEVLPTEQVLDLLASLVDKSLVQTDDGDPAATRCMLLETVRQFAIEQLSAAGELAAARDRHLASGAKAGADRALEHSPPLVRRAHSPVDASNRIRTNRVSMKRRS